MAQPIKISWHEFQGGYLGILPCGFTMVVARITDGPYTGAYQVRFGTCEIRRVFWSPEEAQARAIDYTYEVLLQCLSAVRREMGHADG